MNTHITSSPQIYARTAAIMYLAVILAGITSQMFISGRLITDGDAAMTANNILAHKDLFQLGFTLYMIEMTCQIIQVTLFYILLKPVNRNLARLALVLSLVGCTIKILSRLFYIAPLLVLESPDYLVVFSVEQLQAFAYLLLQVNNQAAGIALPFFGLATFLNGYLVIQSTFLPRILGGLSVLGGLGWLTFLYPPLGNQFFPYILLLGLVGSVTQIVWFLSKGVNVEKWNQANQFPSRVA